MKIIRSILILTLILLTTAVSIASINIDKYSKPTIEFKDYTISVAKETADFTVSKTSDIQSFYMQPIFIISVFALLIIALVVMFLQSYKGQEEKVIKRTAELEKTKKELEAKNTELEKFTYTVSHDLRTPLTTTQGFTEILREHLERNEIEKLKSDLEHIEDGTIKMQHLLDNTLQLSRIGRVTNPPEDISFDGIVREAIEQTSKQIQSGRVDVSIAENFPVVHVDRFKMVEVLINLIVNSTKYMGKQPHPKIEIGYRLDGKETIFFIKDNGIGIDKSQREKVFDLFYKVDRSSNKGTGAGLAIAKRIIEVQGGHIWIESEVSEGCVVCFTVPV